MAAVGLSLPTGEDSHVHLYLCDAVENCRNYESPTVSVDDTDPPEPAGMLADRFKSTSFDGVKQYFVNRKVNYVMWYAGAEPKRAERQSGAAALS